MTSSVQSVATPISSAFSGLRDAQDILVLLSMALAVIASPATPIVTARVTAVIAQHTAMAWAEMLEGVIAKQGGVQ